MKRKPRPISSTLIFTFLLMTSCGSLSHRNDQNEETETQKIDRLQAQNKQLTDSLATLTTKIDSMQTRLSSMNDKIDSTKGRIDNLMSNQKAKPSAVSELPSQGAINLPPVGDNEAEGAFVSDDAVRKYRQAMILFDSRNYPDSVLSFSAFVDQYPDHPLAGSAQYFLGEAYFKQGEFKLAARELARVITTYDRSPHIADTLRDLAIAEDKTGQADEAAHHRQMLTSMFPHSPAAASVRDGSESRESESSNNAANMIDTAPPTTANEAPATNTATHEPSKTPPPAPPALDTPPPTAPMAPTGETKSP